MNARDQKPPLAEGRRRWIVLVLLCTGQLMIMLDSTVVNVALPTIQRDLHFAQTDLAWVVNAYLITFGGLLLLSGRVGDLLGRKQTLLWGTAIFSLASLGCGLAPTAVVLVVARFVQGIGASMMSAMVLGIISTLFPDTRARAVAISTYAFVALGGASLGLVFGGLVVDYLDWHWIFYINVPLGAAVIFLGRRLVESPAGLGIAAGADLWGALLVTTSPMLLVYGLINAGNTSWTAPSTLVPLVGSVVLACTFLIVESRLETPLVPLRVFRHRNFVVAIVSRTLAPIGGFGLFFIAALYLERVLGFSALKTGLAFLPSTLSTAFFSLALMPWLSRRVNLKTLCIVGLSMIVIGLVTLNDVTAHSSFAVDVLPAMFLTGMGFGCFFMPSVSIAMAGVGQSEAGIAAGITNVATQMGASIGIAMLATIASQRSKHLVAMHESAREALAGGYRLSFLVSAGFVAVALVLIITVLRSPNQAAAAAQKRTSEPVEESTLASLG